MIYCEWMNAKRDAEYYPLNDGLLGKSLLTPLKDLPRIEKYEAELKTWIEQYCK